MQISDTTFNIQLFKMWTFDILELGPFRYGKEWSGGHLQMDIKLKQCSR